MVIKIKRHWFTNVSTIGVVEVDGINCGFSLEDVARAEGVKIPGKTAIPAGEYPGTIDFSQRFLKPMPHILDVSNFTGVRIHKGNTSADTEGCVIVGLNKGNDLVYNCAPTFDFIFNKMQEAIKKGEKISIIITNEQI